MTTGWLRRAAGAGVDLVYPPVCGACRQDLVAPADGILLCALCRGKLAVPRSACKRCGATAVNLVENLVAADGPGQESVPCRNCRDARFEFDTVIALGSYHDDLRSAVLRMKRPSGEPLGNAMGRLLAQECRPAFEQFAPTVIISVPMHWTRRIVRGTNSPEVLAAALGKAFGVRVAWRGLVRRRRTVHQNELLPEHRAENVLGAFRVGIGKNLRGARILLVDDVLTTGSTANEATKVVRGAGAAAVAIAVLARAEGQAGK